MRGLVHAPRLVTAASDTPVSLAEAKAHLRVLHGDEDAAIEGMIAAATARLDGWAGLLGRCLVTQGWEVDFDAWPADRVLRLPFPNCEVTAITWRDEAHASQALPSSGYSATFDTDIGSVVVLWEETALPALSARPRAVTVAFTAGYGAPAAVPAALKAATLIMVGDLYQSRATAQPGALTRIPSSAAFEALVAPYRMAGF